MNLEQRFRQLDRLLDDYAWLWRPQPYKEARPQWCEELPQLCSTLLELPEEQLQVLTSDQEQLLSLLTSYLPDLVALPSLTVLAERDAHTLSDTGPHFSVGIPGRKWEQINAFGSALGEVGAPLLEWCGGKGHLGRLLASEWQQPVLTLELDASLCVEGERMAQRARVEQFFHCGDALQDGTGLLVQGRHVVALHACGELHRTLIRRGVASRVKALDIAPCCYHLHGSEHYRPFTEDLRLQLSRDDMRIAVTETVTAVGREVRRRNTEMAWKLGFSAWRCEITGTSDYKPIKPVDKSWLKLGFEGFCRTLAGREGLDVTGDVEWDFFEQLGWQRQREVMRLSLVRHAFRRAIEMWLVLDMANFLISSGYRVSLGTFCDQSLTPRNVLLSARRMT